MRRVLVACGGLLALAALAVDPGRDARAQLAPRAATAAELTVLAAPEGRADEATRSDIRVAAPGSAPARTLGAIPHAPGAVVRGDVLHAASGAIAALVVADETRAVGPGASAQNDYAGALWRVDERGARVLARGVYHASRPLVSSDGRVYVERGAPGPWPTPDEARAGRLREDALSIDAVDPDTGDARTLFTWNGYTLHIAGEHDRELLVYRVAYRVSELVAIDRASGRARLVAEIPPFARDFSVDHARGAIVTSNRDARDARLWVVERIDLTTGARERLAARRDAPFTRTERALSAGSAR